MENQWKQWQTLFYWLQNHADGDFSHEIKRCLLLGRKAMASLDSILKSRDITLATKVCVVKAMVFPKVMYGCESWTIKKAECWRIDAFELWFWRRLLISYVKWIASPGSMRDTGCSGLVHWDDLEEWYGEEGGWGLQDGEHVYTSGGFMLMYGKTSTIL